MSFLIRINAGTTIVLERTRASQEEEGERTTAKSSTMLSLVKEEMQETLSLTSTLTTFSKMRLVGRQTTMVVVVEGLLEASSRTSIHTAIHSTKVRMLLCRSLLFTYLHTIVTRA